MEPLGQRRGIFQVLGVLSNIFPKGETNLYWSCRGRCPFDLIVPNAGLLYYQWNTTSATRQKPQILATAHTETGSCLFWAVPPMAGGLCPLGLLAPWVLVVCLVLGQFSSELLYFEGLEPFPRLVAFYSFVVLFDTQSINRQINSFSFSRIVFFYACRALLHSESYSLAFSS